MQQPQKGGCHKDYAWGAKRRTEEVNASLVDIWFILFLLTVITAVARPQATPDFSGLWEQDNDRCQLKRIGDVPLHTEHHGASLSRSMKTDAVSIRRRGGPSSKRVQRLRGFANASTEKSKSSIDAGNPPDEHLWSKSQLFYGQSVEPLRGRYVQSHARAVAWFTSNLHLAAVEHNDALHNRQSEADTSRRLGP